MPPMNPAPARSSFGRAVLALAVGGFAIGTGEFVIMGLLPEVAADMAVSIPRAGHVISAYALGVVVGAPVLAVLAAHWRRRALLIVLMAWRFQDRSATRWSLRENGGLLGHGQQV